MGAPETDTATPVRLPGAAVTGPGAEAGAWGWGVGTGLGVGPVSARPGSGRGDLGLVGGNVLTPGVVPGLEHSLPSQGRSGEGDGAALVTGSPQVFAAGDP